MTNKKEEKKTLFRRIGGRIVPIAVGGGLISRSVSTRVYKKGDITIDRKGRKMTMRKSGVKIGFTEFRKHGFGGIGDSNIKWLGVAEKHRGKGYGRTIITETARELRRRGKNEMMNAVAGPRAATIKNKSDSFYEVANRKNGESYLKRLKSIEGRDISENPVFRRTKISGLKKSTKYSMNKRVIGNKALFALGAGLIGYGVLKDGR